MTENETEAAEQDYKDSEKKENIDSTTGKSEEILAVTKELNEGNTQIIQNTPAGTRKDTEDRQSIQKSKQKLKVNDIIQYKLKNANDWIKATVIGRAGEATGRNKNWYNIREDSSEETKSVNLDEVEWES